MAVLWLYHYKTCIPPAAVDILKALLMCVTSRFKSWNIISLLQFLYKWILPKIYPFFFYFAELYFTFSESFTLIRPSVWDYSAFSVKSILICVITLIYCISNKSKVTCTKKFSLIFFRSPEAKGFLNRRSSE